MLRNFFCDHIIFVIKKRDSSNLISIHNANFKRKTILNHLTFPHVIRGKMENGRVLALSLKMPLLTEMVQYFLKCMIIFALAFLADNLIKPTSRLRFFVIGYPSRRYQYRENTSNTYWHFTSSILPSNAGTYRSGD